MSPASSLVGKAIFNQVDARDLDGSETEAFLAALKVEAGLPQSIGV